MLNYQLYHSLNSTAGSNVRYSVENCEEAMNLFHKGERARTATPAKSDLDGSYMASR